ncbi:hypothetical protein EYC80_005049 [Monilinia laxa]|uniref:Uncharacterized protein n=1 Tax=Monilinia laxa TaxID=61186 RepID=A0A5N6KIZ6_MONLA|nr:hypothetical protein EYC80_005049 [Monilinia laxa]
MQKHYRRSITGSPSGEYLSEVTRELFSLNNIEQDEDEWTSFPKEIPASWRGRAPLKEDFYESGVTNDLGKSYNIDFTIYGHKDECKEGYSSGSRSGDNDGKNSSIMDTLNASSSIANAYSSSKEDDDWGIFSEVPTITNTSLFVNPHEDEIRRRTLISASIKTEYHTTGDKPAHMERFIGEQARQKHWERKYEDSETFRQAITLEKPKIPSTHQLQFPNLNKWNWMIREPPEVVLNSPHFCSFGCFPGGNDGLMVIKPVERCSIEEAPSLP